MATAAFLLPPMKVLPHKPHPQGVCCASDAVDMGQAVFATRHNCWLYSNGHSFHLQVRSSLRCGLYTQKLKCKEHAPTDVARCRNTRLAAHEKVADEALVTDYFLVCCAFTSLANCLKLEKLLRSRNPMHHAQSNTQPEWY